MYPAAVDTTTFNNQIKITFPTSPSELRGRRRRRTIIGGKSTMCKIYVGYERSPASPSRDPNL